jgi:hypothetical protein
MRCLDPKLNVMDAMPHNSFEPLTEFRRGNDD